MSGKKEGETMESPVKKKKGLGALILVLVLLVAVVGVGIVLFGKGTSTPIDPQEYLTVEFQGYSGFGTVVWDFDEEEFIDDFEDELGFSSSFKKALKGDDNIAEILELGCGMADIDTDDLDDEDAAELLYCILFQNAYVSKSEDLSNGEEVTVVWDFTKKLTEEEFAELCKIFHISLNYEDAKYKVSGLVEVPLFDPFEGVEVSFSGVAPIGRVLLANYPSNGLNYTLDAPAEVKNGDVVTVKVSYYGYDMDEYVNVYGKMPSATEKTYTVSGLPTYITSASQIPAETLEEMKAQAEDVIQSSTYGWIEGYSLDVTYAGNYMLSAKDIYEYPQNQIVLVYKMNYSNVFVDYAGVEHEYPVEYYYWLTWSDLMLDEDGSCIYDLYSYANTRSTFNVHTGIYATYDEFWEWYGDEYYFYFEGCESLDEVYETFITQNAAYYKFEENIEQ